MAKQITREEFYEKYGDVLVSFSNYYKYTFTYDATLQDGKRLTVGYGGDPSQIYRHDVRRDSTETVSQLGPYTGSVYEDGEEVEGFYDY